MIKDGLSKQAIASNVAAMIRAYEDTGKIGDESPKNLSEAKRHAVELAKIVAHKTRKKQKSIIAQYLERGDVRD